MIDEEEEDVNFESNFYHFGLGVNLNMKRVKLIMGSTFATGTDRFDQPIDFPDANLEIPLNEDPSKITITRWQFVIGLEIPLFGHDVEFK